MRLLRLPVAWAVRAEGHDHHLADHVLDAATSALPAHQRVLDHGHHAVRACRDEPRLHRVEEVLVDLHPIEGGLVERGRDVSGGVVLEAKVGAHAEQEDVAEDRAVGVVSDDLSNLCHLAASIRHAGLVDDEVDG